MGEHMDNLVAWGADTIKGWHKQASALQRGSRTEKSCLSQDLQHRAAVQNKLAGICEDMCKEVGAGLLPPHLPTDLLVFTTLLLSGASVLPPPPQRKEWGYYSGVAFRPLEMSSRL